MTASHPRLPFFGSMCPSIDKVCPEAGDTMAV